MGLGVIAAIAWFFWGVREAPVKPAPAGGAAVEAILDVTGMSCAACVNRIERKLLAAPGVSGAVVSLPGHSALVAYDPALTEPARLAEVVSKAGYGATPRTDDEPGEDGSEAELAKMKLNLAIGATFGLPVIVLSMIHVPFVHGWIGRWLTTDWLLLFLSMPVIFVAGAGFFSGAAKALKGRAADMNVLVAIGTGSAFAYSLVATINPQLLVMNGMPPHVYYEVACAIIVLILMGRYLEARARTRAGAAIQRLLSLQPPTATVLRDGQELVVPISDVSSGDHILVRPGEKVAVDGEVVEGVAEVDESMLTGESMPVTRATGDKVFGGTLNTTGAFTFRATAVGKETALARIVRMVERAQASRAPIQRVADRITGVFVPIVLMIATATFVSWLAFGTGEVVFGRALEATIAVLIIACPCALGLATPAAVIVGTGKGAEMGVLFKHAQAIESSAGLDAVVFDKTGTLTKGKPVLTDVVPLDGKLPHELLRIAASAEAGSEHPIGRAIVEAAEGGFPRASSFRAIVGRGVTAVVEGTSVEVAKASALDPDSRFAHDVGRLAGEGKTTMLMSIDGVTSAILAVADEPKEGSAEAVRRLKDLGVQVWMLTGDRNETAQAVASQLGVEGVYAEVLPEEKAQKVQELQAQGRSVAMVGDGINDAPALVQADVGVAMGSGVDVAIEAADVTLARSDPRAVADALELSRATLRTIKQNLFFAFIYNVLAIPLAAFGMLSPMVASVAMSLSSVSVVTNALRLRGFRSGAR